MIWFLDFSGKNDGVVQYTVNWLMGLKLMGFV